MTLPPPVPAGTSTEVSNGSVLVASVPVVTVPPLWSLTVSETITGSGAFACGVTALEEADGSLVPTELVAVTVKV